MELGGETELTDEHELLKAELEQLRAELARRKREAADNALQLEPVRRRPARDLQGGARPLPGAVALLHGHRSRALQRGRGPGRVHGQARRAGGGLRDRDRARARHQSARRARDRVRIPAARHRQGRDSRRDPVQAGSADRGGTRADGASPGDRSRDRGRHRVSPGGRQGRALAPRTLGRERLPRRPARRGDPDRRARVRGGRRVRRADHRPSLPSRAGPGPRPAR